MLCPYNGRAEDAKASAMTGAVFAHACTDLHRVCSRIPVGPGQPEAHGQRRQIVANASSEWRVCQKCARSVDGLFDAVGRLHVVGRDIAPNFEKIIDGLGSEAIT